MAMRKWQQHACSEASSDATDCANVLLAPFGNPRPPERIDAQRKGHELAGQTFIWHLKWIPVNNADAGEIRAPHPFGRRT